MTFHAVFRRTAFQVCFTALMCVSSIGAAETIQETSDRPRDATTVRIAVVQQETKPGDVEKNLAKAIKLARQALSHHPDIILFHEALTVGYVNNIRELAEDVNGPTTTAFQSLLEDSNSRSLILYGLIEKEGDDCYTSATLVNRKGVVANYRKTHLWWADEGLRHEPTFFRPGNQLVTFDVNGYKSGVMICYDGDFPEMTRAYANRDCVLLFWLNNRQSRGHEEVTRLASTNSMIFATSCVCGINESDKQCPGGSNVVDKDGSLLDEIWDKEGVIVVDVAPVDVLAARKKNAWYHGQRHDLYYGEEE